MGGDPARVMGLFAPDRQAAYCRDVARVHTGAAPRLGALREAYGRNVAGAWLEIQLNDLSEFAGCREKLSERQVTELAGLILEGYPHYNMAEVMLFCQRFKQCRYGRFYGAVDPMVIMQALADFDRERRDWWAGEHARREQQERLERDREYAEVAERYGARVPRAYRDDAPLDLRQYRLLGYDLMSDEELAAEVAEIEAGRKKVPKEIGEILDFLEAMKMI